MPLSIVAEGQAHWKFLQLDALPFMSYKYMTVPCGLALALKVFIKCVEAALNPLALSSFVYADGRLKSLEKTQICTHSDYSVFEREVSLCPTAARC